jgi:uncharacterized membrane protein
MNGRRILVFIRTTILGGIFFLLPLIVILFVLGKALSLVQRITIPLAGVIPVKLIYGVPVDRVLAWVVVLAICFIAGLIARFRTSKRFGQWLDRNILSEIPGYTFLKEMGTNIAGLEADESRTPVAIDFGVFKQIGFLIEKINEQHSIVFIPASPSPTSGRLIFIENHKLSKLDIKPTDVMKIMSKMGIGAKHRLQGSL